MSPKFYLLLLLMLMAGIEAQAEEVLPEKFGLIKVILETNKPKASQKEPALNPIFNKAQIAIEVVKSEFSGQIFLPRRLKSPDASKTLYNVRVINIGRIKDVIVDVERRTIINNNSAEVTKNHENFSSRR